MKSRNQILKPWSTLRAAPHQVSELRWKSDAFPSLEKGKTTLAFGMGRSYGDSCLNPDQNACLTENLNHFEYFDPETGYLTCGPGISLDEIIRVFVPKGWFPKVVPGTKFITVGGAIANDIHGKNHHVAGTFGNQTTQITLLRSDLGVIRCSATENSELFHATIGGLGLTGIILSATIKLEPIHSTNLDADYLPFHEIKDFFSLSKESGWTHTVAWIDLTQAKGQGVFMRGNFCKEMDPDETRRIHGTPKLGVPCNFPNWAVNAATIKGFNLLYQSKFKKPFREFSHYEPFFFPLDKVSNWNRVYGSRGFFQYQSVVPKENAEAAVIAMLKEVSKSGNGSPLAVIKTFGNPPKAGLMSFAEEGTTLAMDFPNNGWQTLELMRRLDEIVNAAKGKMYPAKDIRMGACDFQRQYPQWQTLEAFRDPALMSSFWNRVALAQPPNRNQI